MDKFKRKVSVSCAILILMCMADNGLADDFYSNHAVGWHWYNDPEPKKITKPNKVSQNTSDPNAIVASARERITTALNTVIANPTLPNLKNYLELQEQLAKRAEMVANVWQQALLQNPQINYSLTHPTDNIGLQVYHEQQSQEKEAAMKLFVKQSGLFFFYKSTCPYCQRFAPILKNFAAHYGIKIIPITLDGIPLPDFPDSKIDSGQAAQFQVTVTPSLFAVNPSTQKAYPVAYGLTSETELRDNIYKIMAHNAGDNS